MARRKKRKARGRSRDKYGRFLPARRRSRRNPGLEEIGEIVTVANPSPGLAEIVTVANPRVRVRAHTRYIEPTRRRKRRRNPVPVTANPEGMADTIKDAGLMVAGGMVSQAASNFVTGLLKQPPNRAPFIQGALGGAALFGASKIKGGLKDILKSTGIGALVLAIARLAQDFIRKQAVQKPESFWRYLSAGEVEVAYGLYGDEYGNALLEADYVQPKAAIAPFYPSQTTPPKIYGEEEEEEAVDLDAEEMEVELIQPGSDPLLLGEDEKLPQPAFGLGLGLGQDDENGGPRPAFAGNFSRA